jgi:hypothetical protein
VLLARDRVIWAFTLPLGKIVADASRGKARFPPTKETQSFRVTVSCLCAVLARRRSLNGNGISMYALPSIAACLARLPSRTGNLVFGQVRPETSPQFYLLQHLHDLKSVLRGVEFFHQPLFLGQARKT